MTNLGPHIPFMVQLATALILIFPPTPNPSNQYIFSVQDLYFPLMLGNCSFGLHCQCFPDRTITSQLSALTLNGAMVLSYGMFVSVQEK